MPLHSSLGNKSETLFPPQKKIKRTGEQKSSLRALSAQTGVPYRQESYAKLEEGQGEDPTLPLRAKNLGVGRGDPRKDLKQLHAGSIQESRLFRAKRSQTHKSINQTIIKAGRRVQL